MTQVFIIDDNDGFRTSIEWSLEDQGFAVSSFPSAAEFISRFEKDLALVSTETANGCVLSDIRMPVMSGIELIDELWRRQIRLPVILMSAHADIPLTVEAMNKGAAHVLEKPFDTAVLAAVIRTVANQPLSHPHNPDDARNRLRRLSPRERQVLDLICAGNLNKTIADTLGISVKTVELHRSRLSQKLKVKNIHELIKMTMGYT
jgi:two-component system response regulator FixJ